MMNPLHKRVVRNLDMRNLKGKILRNLWACLFTLVTLLVILVPISFMVFQFTKQIVELIRYIQDTFMARPSIITEVFEAISEFLNDISAGQVRLTPQEIERAVLQVLNSSMQRALQVSGRLAGNVGNFFVSLAMMFFCLYFFYVDGATLANLVKHAIPIRKEYMQALVTKISDSTKNLFLGYIVVSLFQAIMGGIIFTIFQVKGALVFAVLVFICAFIPMLGGGLVWWPLGITFLINGEIVKGIVFIIVSAIGISFLDNFLRPVFLQDRIKLHPLIIFFAILGGISAFGFNGLVLGPMIVILFLTGLDLFLNEHKIQED